MNTVKLNPRVILRSPTFKKLEEIRKMEKVRKRKGEVLGGMYAFVEPHFRFVHDHLKDWKPVSAPANYRQFIGTSLTLEVSPEVFLPSEFQKYPMVLAPIQRHEQEHISDARDIVTRLLPAELGKDDTFKKYFLDRKPIPEGTYRYMLPKKVADYITEMFWKLWNDAVDKRDTAARYKVLQEQVDKARRAIK